VPKPRSQHAYQIHVYRATVRPDAGRGVLHRNVVSDRHRRVGGQRSRRSGRQSPRLIRSVEDAAPGVAALPAHRLDREQHLLTIRTPRTTSSEIAVALWSSRTSTTVPSRISRTTGSSASERASQAPSRPSPCAKPGSPCPCSWRRRTVPSRHGAPALVVMTPEQEAEFDLIGRQLEFGVPAALVPVHGNTVGALTWRGAGAWKCWSAVVRGGCKTGEQYATVT
jgi:hypothetical protein